MSANSESREHDSDTDALLTEQIRLLYRSLPSALFTVVISAALLLFVQWSVIDHTVLLGWFGAILALSIGRWLLFLHYQHNYRPGNTERYWIRSFVGGSLLSGIIWGAAGYLLFPPDNLAHQVYIAFVLAGMAAGAVTSLSALRSAALAFLLPSLLPLIVRLLGSDTTIGTMMGIMVILFLLMLTMSTERFQTTIREMFQLRRAHHRAEKAAHEREQQNTIILNSAAEGIFGVNKEGIATFVNPAAARMLGYEVAELVGQPIHSAIHHSHADSSNYPQAECPMSQAIRDGQQHHVLDEVLWHRDGRAIPVDYTSTPIISHGVIEGAVITFSDITEQRRAEARIEYQAYYDTLTDLPNRRLLMDRLQQELVRARRHGHFGAVLFLDLDRFKNINDSLGHFVGDHLLKEAAQRLHGSIRQEDTAARLGGDEFVILLAEVSDDAERTANTAQAIAEKISARLSQAYHVAGYELHTSASIGIALFPMAEESADDILKQADIAMYRAKELGRNTTQFYLPSMQLAASERLQIENDLRQAIAREEFELYYQPQVDAHGALIGAEALLRWHHPVKGIIAPASFISIAEESGLILPLGEWTLRQACQQINHWSELAPDISPHIAVNVSACQFQQQNFVSRTCEIIAASGIDPHCLELEITEGLLLGDFEESRAKMHELKRIGVRFSIDDFGTGYSSLAYLTQLSVDKLKIDKSFVRDINHDRNYAAIVETIISMARHLKLDVIAEGVETAEELEFLAAKGCRQYQGYYFSHPLTEADFRSCLARGCATAAIKAAQSASVRLVGVAARKPAPKS